jgi:hypothetical protein
MSGVFVALEILAIALRLMSWFGLRARDARVPFFDVEPISIAVVPISKMFGGVGVWCLWWLAIWWCHLIVWWRDVAICRVVASGSIWRWCAASSSTLVSPASSCILSTAAFVLARLVVWLRVLRGGYVRWDVRWHVRLLCQLRLVVKGWHVVGGCRHGIWHHLHLLGVCQHCHLLC